MGPWSEWTTGCDDYGLQTRSRAILDDPYTCNDWCPDTLEYRECVYSNSSNDYVPPTTAYVFLDGGITTGLEAEALTD
jgi:hypothetical protein